MAKYTTYQNDNKVIVVSKYAGKAVRGVAKCDPADVFNGVFGEDLAKARCDLKISTKRHRRACELAVQALEDLKAAQARVDKMIQFVNESTVEVEYAKKHLEDLEAQAGAR